MPSRNSIKYLYRDGIYHVCNRGAGGQSIFVDDHDKDKFLSLFQRYLDPNSCQVGRKGYEYKKYDKAVELNSFCLMGNHFHLLLTQIGSGKAVAEFIHSLATSYTVYYNLRHKRQGTLFQGVYKASNVDDETYLAHITRYIHRNPSNRQTYKYSSYRYYLGNESPIWCKPARILCLFSSTTEYKNFVEQNLDIGSEEYIKRIRRSIGKTKR